MHHLTEIPVDRQLNPVKQDDSNAETDDPTTDSRCLPETVFLNVNRSPKVMKLPARSSRASISSSRPWHSG